MARRGENIYQRKNGRWEGKYIKCRINGKIQYGYVSGKSYEEVLWKKHEALRAIASHKEIPQVERAKFAVVAEEWMKVQEPVIKETSLAKYRGILDHYLLPKYGAKQVTEITREDVTCYLQSLLITEENKKGLSPKTVTGIFSVLKTILDYTKRCRHSAVVDLCNVPVRQIRRPLRILSVNEQHSLEGYLAANMNRSKFGIMLCLYTGIRLGELCALKWKDISFEDRTLYVHGTMERVPEKETKKGGKKDRKRKTKIIVTMPKSSCSVRYIPIPDNIYGLAEEMKGPEDSFLLTGSLEEYIEPRTMENHFQSALKECGIAEANFHALRHTFATRCVELGFDAKSLSEILGHASVRITMDRYVHPTMEAKQKNMERLSKLMSEPS